MQWFGGRPKKRLRKLKTRKIVALPHPLKKSLFCKIEAMIMRSKVISMERFVYFLILHQLLTLPPLMAGITGICICIYESILAGTGNLNTRHPRNNLVCSRSWRNSSVWQGNSLSCYFLLHLMIVPAQGNGQPWRGRLQWRDGIG